MIKTLVSIFVVFCGSVVMADAPSAARPGELRVMSFNVRTSSAQDGENGWTFRKHMVVETVRAFDPDLLGTQEVRPEQYDLLTSQMTDYSPVGVGRDDG